MLIALEFVPYEQLKTMMGGQPIILLPKHSLMKAPIVVSLEQTHGRLVGMMTIAVSVGLSTACVKPSLMRSLVSITTRLAYFGFTSKFGNCYALYYFSRAMSLDLKDIKVTD
jgi:hypothetical protein